MWISRSHYQELIDKIEFLSNRLKERRGDDSMSSKSLRAKKVIDNLGLKAESAKQIKEAIAMEILADEFEMQDKYGKAAFLKNQDTETLHQVKEMIQQAGVLTRKRIEKKK
jgi:hypothetical protein